MSTRQLSERLRMLVSLAKANDEFMAITKVEWELMEEAADALEQMELQKNSAIAVSRKLQDEREELLARVEAALLGIQSVESRDEDEEDTRRS